MTSTALDLVRRTRREKQLEREAADQRLVDLGADDALIAAIADEVALVDTLPLALASEMRTSRRRDVAAEADRVAAAMSMECSTARQAARRVIADELAASAAKSLFMSDKSALFGRSAVERYRRELRDAGYLSIADQRTCLNAALDSVFWEQTLSLISTQPIPRPDEIRRHLRAYFEARLGSIQPGQPEHTDHDGNGDGRWVAQNHPHAVLLDARDIADALDCSVPTARKMMAAGQFGPYSFGERKKFVTLTGYTEHWEATGQVLPTPEDVGVRAIARCPGLIERFRRVRQQLQVR